MMTDLDVTALAAQLLATTKDGLVIADPVGTIVYWNHGAADMFCHPPSEALGASLDLIVPEGFRARHWEGYANTMRTGQTSYADRVLAVPAAHRDGHRLSIEFRVTLLGDDPIHPAAIGAVIRDVSERWDRDRRIRTRLAELEGAQGAPNPSTENRD
jgi:PAS domain S-box-containing protein